MRTFSMLGLCTGARALVGAGRARARNLALGAGMQSVPLNRPVVTTTAFKIDAGGAIRDFVGDALILPFLATADGSVVDLESGAAATWDAALDGAVSELARDQAFSGKSGSSAVVRLTSGNAVRKVALFGLGDAASYAELGAFAAKLSSEEKVKHVGVLLGTDGWTPKALEQLSGGALDAAHVDNRFRTEDNIVKPPPLERLSLLEDSGPDLDDVYPDTGCSVAAVASAAQRASGVAFGVSFAKDLVAAPANIVTPRTLANSAVAMCEQDERLSIRVMGPVECERLGMGAYLGVAQGASDENQAQFIHITYAGPQTPGTSRRTTLAVVGKGLTYDSGGYNLKPSSGGMIELMKFDMGGSAAALGAAAAVAALGVADCDVHFIVAACENMISDTAMRPGDVLTASNGKTIEVINTDAEGRLTLADALVYAERTCKPDAIVDLATLTGACIVALGEDVAGLFTPDDALAAELEQAAATAGEQIWRLPLVAAYEADIKSKIADLKNVGGKGGGSITAAMFLQHFVTKETPWAHLDIAGPAWNGKTTSATGFGVKTLVEWIETKAKANACWDPASL